MKIPRHTNLYRLGLGLVPRRPRATRLLSIATLALSYAFGSTWALAASAPESLAQGHSSQAAQTQVQTAIQAQTQTLSQTQDLTQTATQAQTQKQAPQRQPVPVNASATAKSIPFDTAAELKNRFRIDHLVSHVTLLIERDYGSSPVVVVLPDGTKWYADRHPDTVKWAEGLTGDMIYIPSPQPGPWQLLGKVSAGSKIKKVSTFAIEVQPLPQPLFQGEQLKIHAQLQGDAQRIRMPGLDYLVEWTAHFESQHQSGDENFAAGTIMVGSYKDNGEAYDERPDDGLFTSNIALKQPWGAYDFVVKASNNVFERQVSFPFTLSPPPITLELIEPEDFSDTRWRLTLQIDTQGLQLAATHFSFELYGPAGLQIPLEFRDITQATTELILPSVTEFGSYRVKGVAVSTTVTGREIVLDLPERFFNLTEPPPAPPSPEVLAAQAAQKAAEEEALAKQNALFWIATINGVLLIFGIIGLIVWRKRQSLAQALVAAEQRLIDERRHSKSAPTSVEEIDLTMPD
ncbi:TIGR03503 family protein [Shewanella sp.]|uniref:TIGR03503 family protein n=1 Tax=Shewanella sp. TaxID=50422 RepID=UPI003F2D3FD7